MDWKEIIQISARELEDQQKDELCKHIIFLDDVGDINIHKLKKLFRLSQELLQYKDEQVEMLISEFDEIARKQGVEEARTIQSLENEIKSLRSSSDSRLQTPPDTDIIKQNDQLKLKIKSLKNDLKIKAKEIEKLNRDMVNIQEEKNMIQSELLQASHRDSDTQSESSEIFEKHQHLTDNIRQKNRQISQLLNDIEVVEKENITLKEKIITLRDELKEATEHLTNVTTEISQHKSSLMDINEKLNTTSNENISLRNQIEDLVKQKHDREDEIDKFSSKLDKKVDELKKLLKVQQLEIKDLKQENSELENKLMGYSSGLYTISTSILKEKDEQIEDLESKLIEATIEIENTTTLLNKISTSRKQNINIEQDAITDDLKSKLLTAHERCQELQSLLESTEQDAQNQGQQLTELLNQLHKYEKGQYGLTDALKEIQELRVQINVRDKQISELVQTCNKLQTNCSEVEHENLALREKCGLPLDATISKNTVVSKQRKQKKLITNLQNQIEVLEDEKLQMKVDLQKFKRQLSNFEDKPQLEHDKMVQEDQSSYDVDYKKKFSELSEENEALRKGMHEILESIRLKKGTSSKEIKSKTLQQLVHILDARHVSGWYHPAMKLQAEVNTLEGIIEELRNQLKLSREEINKTNEQLQQAEFKYQELVKAQDSKEISISVELKDTTTTDVPSNVFISTADIITKLHTQTLTVLDENKMDSEKSDEKLEIYKREINVIRQQVDLLHQQFITEQSTFGLKYEETFIENENLLNKVESLQSKLETYLTSNKKDIDEKLSNDFITLNRKCLYLEGNEKKLSTENNKLKLEMCQIRTTYSEHVKALEIERNNLLHKLNTVENTLRDSVPKNKLDNANKTIYDLTTKHRDLLQNVNCFKESNNILLYKKEIELLNSEKDTLFFELLQVKSKVHLVEHVNDEIENLSKKITNLELSTLSESQRADHVNSLYELVKDQLKKCEERCMEYENQNKLLISSNLKLQLSQQELQDKLINSISNEDYKIINDKIVSSQEELNNMQNKYEKLLSRNNAIENELKTYQILKTVRNIETMSLKHLLLDLQSTTDEKALIARLSTEVILARICETETKNRLEIVTDELKQMNENLKQKDVLMNESNLKLNTIQSQYEIKIRILEQILHNLRSQYLGCNPLCSYEKNVENLRQIYSDKQTAFNELQVVQKQKNEIILLQEQLNLELQNTMELKSVFLRDHSNSKYDKILEWYKDKHGLQLNEFKFRRNLEIKETELHHALERMNNQDKELLQLEEELLRTSNNVLNNLFNYNVTQQNVNISQINQENILSKRFIETGTNTHTSDISFNKKTVEIQTIPISEKSKQDEIISALQNEIRQAKQLLSLKDNNLQRQLLLISELEKNIETLKTQLHDKDIQSELSENVPRESRSQLNVIDEIDLKEHNALKKMVTKLQLMITQKEDVISKYETLLKEGKDEHSLAASRFQEEIKQLQINLQKQLHAYQELKNSIADTTAQSEVISNKSAIEQYVSQVHTLETHTAELQTSVSSLNSQLHASRQESVRWRTLANDRLNAIETLRKEFDVQHEEEISTYKIECDKYKEENINIKQDLSKLRVELNQKNLKINQELQEKDSKIHELTLNLMQAKNNLKMYSEGEKLENFQEMSELKLSKQLLETEYETLKKRFEQLTARDKTSREEIRNLRGQLIKRPILSVRSDRSEKNFKEQLQKKISILEQELSEANDKLERSAMLNEARKVKIAEDFTLWEKQKRWQQIAEKTKEKLAIKSEELEKVQLSYSSAKSIISRLEREKHILEGKLKFAKTSTSVLNSSRYESIEQENIRLKNDVEILTTKLEMQHHHSGGLGAAMLQEKLEAQERKIAVLELSTKGSAETTAELERLNNTIATLQKTNLRLEAQNLELNLDLKKAGSDAPYLREQIQHLQRYIDVLKSEQSEHHVTNTNDQLHPSNTKIVQLEKTVLSLRRLVEKLQAENKRLQLRPCSVNSDRKVPQSSTSDNKYQLELKRVREQYSASIQRSSKLDNELTKAKKRVRFLENALEAKQAENESSLLSELSDVKAQLVHKSQLLDKVKILLQKAALKEKFLQDQIERFKMENAAVLAIESTTETETDDQRY